MRSFITPGDAVLPPLSRLSALDGQSGFDPVLFALRVDSDMAIAEICQRMRRRMWPVYERAIDTWFDRHLAAGEHATLRALLVRVLEEPRDQE